MNFRTIFSLAAVLLIAANSVAQNPGATVNRSSSPALSESTPFRLGEERTIPITGQILMPDGSHAGRTWFLTHHVSGWQNVSSGRWSDEQGLYTVNANPGAYFMAMVRPQVEGSEELVGLASTVVAQIITDPPIPGLYDIWMVEGTKVHGKLTYADGSPAAKKRVSITAYGFGRETITTRREGNASSGSGVSISKSFAADENGKYAFYLAPGEYDIFQADADGDDSKTQITIKEGDKELRFDFTVPPHTRGTILLPDGSPAANLTFEYGSLLASRGAITHRGETDENGNFAIIFSEYGNVIYVKTADGKYGIVKYLKGEERFASQTWMLQEACVGKVRLVCGAGQPIAGHALRLSIRLRSETFGLAMVSLATASDQEGNVELKPIFPTGEYSLSFVHPPGVRSYPATGVSFFPQKSGEVIDLGTVEVRGFTREPATVSPP